ncbi:haloacid dehalogenase type II [Legionella londiniensis]
MYKIFDARTGIKAQNNPINSKSCIKAVLFDVFGTVVDWRGTIVKEFGYFFDKKEVKNITSEEFVAVWVNAYSENMQKISKGERAFATVDELNKLALIEIMQQYAILDKFTNEEIDHMSMVWHRLEPWPDSVSGIHQIKDLFITGTLSNGNIKLLEGLSKKAQIDWDVILSGESFRCYKPNPLVYQNAAKVLKLEPSEILLVASHKYDLVAAHQCGYQTAYIFRPLEFKTVQDNQIPKDSEFDFLVDSLDDLAEMLKTLKQNSRYCGLL